MLRAVIVIAQENNAGASDFQVALVGLLGAIVGGLITGGVTLVSEGRRQHFAREMERERWLREDEYDRALVRSVARTVHTQFRNALIEIEGCLMLDQWWLFEEDAPRVEVSLEDRKILARPMAKEDWATFEAAELALAILIRRGKVYLDAEQEPTVQKIDDANRNAMERAKKMLRDVITVLADLADVRPGMLDDAQFEALRAKALNRQQEKAREDKDDDEDEDEIATHTAESG